MHTEIHVISFHDYQKKRRLIFRKTCNACPTQYDIYDTWKSKKPKYYGRLRWGYFYVADKPLGKPIYQAQFKDDLQGYFYSVNTEIKHLKEVCKKIWKIKKNGTKSKELRKKEK